MFVWTAAGGGRGGEVCLSLYLSPSAHPSYASFLCTARTKSFFFLGLKKKELLACSFLDVAWGHNPSSYESHFREGLEAAAGEEETERMSILCWA